MQHSSVMALTAAALAATLMTGCADDPDRDNPCGSQPIVYVEREDGEDEYHCGTPTGAIVPVYLIDADTKKRAKSSPGKGVSFKPLPKPGPKVDMKKPAPAAPKPAAPRSGKR